MSDAGVFKYISDNVSKLNEVYCSIKNAFGQLYPDEDVTQSEAIFPVFWFYIRWADPIQDLILQHFDQEEFHKYGGMVSMRIMKEVMRTLQMDSGIVKVKYTSEQDEEENQPK